MTLLTLTMLLAALLLGLCGFGVLFVLSLCRAAALPVPSPCDDVDEDDAEGGQR